MHIPKAGNSPIPSPDGLQAEVHSIIPSDSGELGSVSLDFLVDDRLTAFATLTFGKGEPKQLHVVPTILSEMTATAPWGTSPGFYDGNRIPPAALGALIGALTEMLPDMEPPMARHTKEVIAFWDPQASNPPRAERGDSEKTE